jgi:hypothetical protein
MPTGAKDIVYTYDFPRWADGKVHYPQAISISAAFKDPRMINLSADFSANIYLERTER